ncbi:HAD family hydrolase, partial [Microbacterium sp. Bi128]|uniref:HAD family hydrolase n=1 Tax=Microbacterium sp. Bi128 TaxID=2821115 RepID=UPI001E49B3B7
MTTMTESSVAGNDDRRTTHQNTTDQNTTDQNTAAPASAARVGNSRNRAGDKMLIALDVDGTLVDHDGHMSVPVREAAQAVVAAGHHVMIATGRSLNATLPVIEHIGIENGYAVCSNGGVILRVDSGLPEGYEILHKATFDPGPVLRALRKRLPSAKYALEDGDGNFLSTE